MLRRSRRREWSQTGTYRQKCGKRHTKFELRLVRRVPGGGADNLPGFRLVRLAFSSGFYCHYEVSAESDRQSRHAAELTEQVGGSAFVTTHWSVVLAAQGSSPAADEALEKLCRTYWRPIYSFVRREGRTIEDAQDLTQSFFARFLERRDLDAVRQEKGRLRSYLLVSLKHFLINERQRATSIKRGEGYSLISLEELLAHERNDPEPRDAFTADRVYERRWALTVLNEVLAGLGEEYRAAGNSDLFVRFKELLSDGSNRASQGQIAAEFGMAENALKQAFHRFRRRYRELLREEIAHTVAVPGDIEDELRHLIAVLRA